MDSRKYCVITEQGDLGLGAEVLNSKDQKVMDNYQKNQRYKNEDDDADDEDSNDDID